MGRRSIVTIGSFTTPTAVTVSRKCFNDYIYSDNIFDSTELQTEQTTF